MHKVFLKSYLGPTEDIIGNVTAGLHHTVAVKFQSNNSTYGQIAESRKSGLSIENFSVSKWQYLHF